MSYSFSCPNCHSQTENFKTNNTWECGETGKHTILRRSRPKGLQVRVPPFPPKIGVTKINWPTNTDLKSLVWSMPSTHLAKILGISDRAITKHCAVHGIQKPPRGFWSMVKSGYIQLPIAPDILCELNGAPKRTKM